MKIGIRIGGSGGDPLSGVPADGTSSKYVPENAASWAAVMASAGITSGGPIATWLCQESSGDWADSIGSFTLGAVAPLTYQKTIPGWSRKGIGSAADGGAGSAALTGAAIGDIQTASGLLLAYVHVASTPAATRDIIGLGGATSYRGAQTTTTPAYKATPNDGSATATGSSNPGTDVRPVIVQVNRAASTWRVITDQEIVAPSPWTAPPVVNAAVFVGATLTTTPDFSVLYAACFRGAAAELSSTQIRALLRTLGWTIAW